MVKLISKTNIDGDKSFHYEFSGLSTDTLPTEWEGQTIEEKSLFLELDTGTFYYYTNEEWVEVGQAPSNEDEPSEDE